MYYVIVKTKICRNILCMNKQYTKVTIGKCTINRIVSYKNEITCYNTDTPIFHLQLFKYNFEFQIDSFYIFVFI